MAGYGTVQGFKDYLALSGRSHNGNDNTIPAHLQDGSAYVDGLYSGVSNAQAGQVFTGYPTGGVTQERAWPRTGATFYGQAIASDVIPIHVIYAGYEAAYWSSLDSNSLTTALTSSQIVTREKVGSIEVEYSDKSSASAGDMAAPLLTAVYGLLKPYLTDQSANQIGIWAV